MEQVFRLQEGLQELKIEQIIGNLNELNIKIRTSEGLLLAELDKFYIQ